MKYLVIYLNLEEANCTILSVHSDYKNALESLNLALDNNPDFGDSVYFKKYHDSKDVVSIYRTNYIMSKTLIGRYCIKSFSENTESQTTQL
jgi:hypothetical protein